MNLFQFLFVFRDMMKDKISFSKENTFNAPVIFAKTQPRKIPTSVQSYVQNANKVL